MCDKTQICFRCRGRKKLYKVRSIYSFIDTGGNLVDCPLCQGKGYIKKLTTEEKIDFVEKSKEKLDKQVSDDKVEVKDKEVKVVKKRGRPKKNG